jgi:hypothetical protein
LSEHGDGLTGLSVGVMSGVTVGEGDCGFDGVCEVRSG